MLVGLDIVLWRKLRCDLLDRLAAVLDHGLATKIDLLPGSGVVL